MTDPYWLDHPDRPWALDATHLVDRAAVEALPFPAALEAMRQLEAGAVANPTEGRRVGHYWLRDPERAPDDAAERVREARDAVDALVDAARSDRLTTPAGRVTDVIHVGIGGSALGPQLLVDALAEPGAGLPVHWVDNADPDTLHALVRHLGERLATSLIVVVTKSGGTAETLAGLDTLHAALRDRGLAPGPATVGITVPGSRLDERARSEGWKAVIPLADWIGGRFSVTSAVGLLPAGLAGIDLDAFLQGAADMDAWTRTAPPAHNPACVLAAAWHHHATLGRTQLAILPYADRMLLLGRYLQQLIMESLGKEHDRQGREARRGLAVWGNKGSTDQHAVVQQLHDGADEATALILHPVAGRHEDEVPHGHATGDLLQSFVLGTRRSLADAGRPVGVLGVPAVDAATLGAVVALFERAVGLTAELWDLNAYDQPGVEHGKKAGKDYLALQRALLDGNPPAQARPEDVAWILWRQRATGRGRG